MTGAADHGRAHGLILDESDVHEPGLAPLQDLLQQGAPLVEVNARAGHVHGQLAAYTPPVSVTHHAGNGWHMHFRTDVLPAHPILMTFITAGTALHFVHRGIHRLRRCERQGCATAFADFSRPATQRSCCRAGANTDAVRRQRHRHRDRP